MKKIIVIIFIVLIVFFTTNMKAAVQSDSNISRFESEVKKILKTVSPSILKVVAENHRKNFATGIAIDPSHVVSNINIIQRPFAEIYIETVTGKKFTAKVVGKDKKSSLILLKIDENALTPIKHARFYEVGDWVALVGAFYKEFPAIYQGILSSALEDQVILNAPVVPGSSGGAVLNKNGELIGVIRGRISFAFSPDYTFKDHSGEIHIESLKSQHKDLCTAVPVKEVVDITNDLKKYGKVRRGWLGVSLVSKGGGPVTVSYVSKDSPAEKAGLRVGDVILNINEKIPKAPEDVGKIVRALKPEQKVKVELLRGKTRESALVVIGEFKEGKKYTWTYRISPRTDSEVFIPEAAETLPKQQSFVYTIGANRTLGVEVMNLTPQLAKELNVKEGSGLMIAEVYKNTAAEKAGFRAADVITKVGNKSVKTNSDLRKALNELEDDEAVTVEVYRKGKLEKIKVVPDKRQGYGVIFEKFVDKMKDINIRFEEEKLKQIEEAEKIKEDKMLHQVQEKYLKEIQLLKEQQLKKYKEEFERMKQQQEKMMQEMKKLRQELEKKKKEEAKDKSATKI